MGKGIILIILLHTLCVSASDIKIAVISDLNGSYGSTQYSKNISNSINDIIAKKPDLVIATGDLVAGMSTKLSSSTFKTMWESFHKEVTQKLKVHGIKLFVTPGNHDASSYKGYSRERVEFSNQWKLENSPKVDFISSEFYPFRYAFTFKNRLFISLDSTTGLEFTKKSNGQNTDQYLWLERILSFSNEYDQIIVFGHIPIIPVARSREDGYIKDNFGLLELFKKYNVNYYLNGHHHTYYPGEIEGVKHITQGCLGSGVRSLIGGSTDKQPESYTFLTLGADEKVEGIMARSLNKIDHQNLPDQILFKSKVMYRID